MSFQSFYGLDNRDKLKQRTVTLKFHSYKWVTKCAWQRIVTLCLFAILCQFFWSYGNSSGAFGRMNKEEFNSGVQSSWVVCDWYVCERNFPLGNVVSAFSASAVESSFSNNDLHVLCMYLWLNNAFWMYSCCCFQSLGKLLYERFNGTQIDWIVFVAW